MALLLFLQFGIVLQLIGLQLLVVVRSGPYMSVNALVNVEVPGPHIQFEKIPPDNALISPKFPAVILPCRASILNETVRRNSKFKNKFYTWYRNGERIISARGYHISENGSLTLPQNEKASGHYHCLANGTELGVGAIFSPRSHVEYAVLKRPTPNVQNVTAIIGGSIALNCTIFSIPKANISWSFTNNTAANQLIGSRYFYLQNGGLLITNITENDEGRFRCFANNSFASKSQRQIVWNLSTKLPDDADSPKRTGLLPPMQNSILYVLAGDELRLHCASFNSGQIKWRFIDRRQNNTHKLKTSNEVLIEHASSNNYDGVYKCCTQTECQEFDVHVIQKPIIQHQLISLESSLAAPVSFTCNATGNPKPKITWYRNGIRLENTYTVYFKGSSLQINSFDIEDEGVYQCVATNIAGEAMSYGLLHLRKKEDLANMPHRPERLHCYPVNYETLYVTFDSSPSSLSMMILNVVTENPFHWTTPFPVKLIRNSSIKIVNKLPILKPFMLFLRGMVQTSTQSSNGLETRTFAVSSLSDGIKCATQGLNVNAVFFPTGIFIWWPQKPSVKATSYTLQFWCNETSNFFNIHDINYLNGTVDPISLYQTRYDIEPKLTQVLILAKQIYSEDNIIREPRSIDANARHMARRTLNNGVDAGGDDDGGGGIGGRRTNHRIPETIVEIEIEGNVTGVLIPGISKATARVLITTKENEKLDLNLKYVEWKTIENITDRNIIINVAQVEPRSVTFEWNLYDTINCVRVCYLSQNIDAMIRNDQQITCNDIQTTNRYFTVKSLKPSTIYRLDFYGCTSKEYYSTNKVQTKPDAPGPITNQKITRNGGLKLNWEPPINPNGQIIYYVIQWTLKNYTQSANVTAIGKEMSFKFPNVTEDDKINVTIRAVGTSGIGLPIYVDLRKIETNHLEEEHSPTDHTLGIVLGILLSIIIIAIFICIFILQKRNYKMRAQNENRTGTGAGSPPMQGTCTNELHEIQTLIPRKPPENITNRNDVEQPLNFLPNGNGIYYHPSIESSAQSNQRIKVQETSSHMLASSTPNYERRRKFDDASSDNICSVSNILSKSANDSSASHLNFTGDDSMPNLFNGPLSSTRNSQLSLPTSIIAAPSPSPSASPEPPPLPVKTKIKKKSQTQPNVQPQIQPKSSSPPSLSKLPIENHQHFCDHNQKLQSKILPQLAPKPQTKPQQRTQIQTQPEIRSNIPQISPVIVKSKPTNGNLIQTQYQNGSIKTKLPPSLTHSIKAVTTNEPQRQRSRSNDKRKVADHTQYLRDSNINTSIFDNSHQRLLDPTLDRSTINNKYDERNCLNDSNCSSTLTNSNTNPNQTQTTIVDMNDDNNSSFYNKTNLIKTHNWNCHLPPIIDPNG